MRCVRGATARRRAGRALAIGAVLLAVVVVPGVGMAVTAAPFLANGGRVSWYKGPAAHSLIAFDVVVDAETLRAAQADPDAHRHLIVRVAGYSDYFCDIGKELQDEIIARTAQEF